MALTHGERFCGLLVVLFLVSGSALQGREWAGVLGLALGNLLAILWEQNQRDE